MRVRRRAHGERLLLYDSFIIYNEWKNYAFNIIILIYLHNVFFFFFPNVL